MKKITIYCAEPCPWCVKAKKLMDLNNIKYDEIKIDFDSVEFDKLVERTKMQTVPQIFFGEELIGGFPEIKELIDNDKVEAMLKE
jgi:glutaredoxin 3